MTDRVRLRAADAEDLRVLLEPWYRVEIVRTTGSVVAVRLAQYDRAFRWAAVVGLIALIVRIWSKSYGAADLVLLIGGVTALCAALLWRQRHHVPDSPIEGLATACVAEADPKTGYRSDLLTMTIGVEGITLTGSRPRSSAFPLLPFGSEPPPDVELIPSVWVDRLVFFTSGGRIRALDIVSSQHGIGRHLRVAQRHIQVYG